MFIMIIIYGCLCFIMFALGRQTSKDNKNLKIIKIMSNKVMSKKMFKLGQEVFYYEKVENGYTIKKSYIDNIFIDGATHIVYYSIASFPTNSFTNYDLFASEKEAYKSLKKYVYYRLI